MEGWIAMADVPEDVQRWTAKRRVALVLSRRSHAEPPEPRGGGARPGNRDLRGVRGRVFVNRDRAMSRIERVSYRRVREAPSGVEAPPGDHVRGSRPPRGCRRPP